ncbi:uncharacterized protein LOC113511218 [Galleria mellonella]|uniref:Uncharacterized protein LOC113511218 n=1 Tax=Galleria mellonella TaxID=7137 RepID=A0A6J1WC98_GALME|nr:uncharacterized protein LOC113511218 [Galleria mellonella]
MYILFINCILIWLLNVDSLSSNISHWSHKSDLPRIQNGQSCVPGKLYRMDCNTCRCGEENSLLCTKMACLTDEDIDAIFHESKPSSLQEEKKDNILRKRMKSDLKYPDVPSKKCVPGKLYKKGCRKCFCDQSGTARCANRIQCNDDRSILMLTPEDVRPRFEKEELNSLSLLPNTATRCEPGKAYKVDCNFCLCLINRNLLCSKMLCLSFNDTYRIKALKYTGKPCEENETTENECIKCSCITKLTRCKEIPDCIPNAMRTPHGEHGKKKPKLMLSLKKDNDKCIPFSVYNDDCNKCYCQDDSTLRCTQKICLNYVQFLKLKKRRLYLEKHGL